MRTANLKAGDQFGKLTLVEPLPRWHWKCKCACGNDAKAYAGHLRNGTRVSCGCLNGSGNRKHGMAHSPEYKAWDNARSRCYRVKDQRYPQYGGRGITMCDRWRGSFPNFIEDMGRRPSPVHTLDRANNDGPYSPENCRWATRTEQNNNRSINRHLTVSGERVTVAQAARLTGIPHATILGRLYAGKSDEEAVR